MGDLQTRIEQRFRDAVAASLGEEHASTDPLIRPTSDPGFGDFQANLAMGLAKRLRSSPRDVAGRIADQLDVEGLFDQVEIAGPGFINLTLTAAALEQHAAAMLVDDRLGVPEVESPRTIVVDYSGPNVAKEMHVGHLRSTVIGAALVRVLRFAGHHVLGHNHLGDWGTQFGMLIEHLVEQHQPPGVAAEHREIGDLNVFYQAARQRFDADPAFADRARQRVIALQAGEPETIRRWRQLVGQSREHFDKLYRRLDIEPRAPQLEYRPESSYNRLLPEVIGGLNEAGLLQESEGARVVYPQGFVDREGEPMGMIVEKTGGGYLYATTDLAAARHRLDDLHADRIIYVTDARQSQHFAMVFQTLRQAGWVRPSVRMDHVPFGSILGTDRKPFKTRSGEVVKLSDVLDQAEQRAAAVIDEKSHDLSAAERERIAHVVGVGALKYADLSTDRVKDYVFDWDRMLALEGNTAPYLQNAYVRIRSIFRKVEEAGGPQLGSVQEEPEPHIVVTDPAERALILHLLQLPRVVAAVAGGLQPHRLCNYLFDLAAAFHQFYERCPVLTAPDEATRASRLRLSDLVARTLAKGLSLLGIGVVERM